MFRDQGLHGRFDAGYWPQPLPMCETCCRSVMKKKEMKKKRRRDDCIELPSQGGGGGGEQGVGANLLLRHIIIVILAAACPSTSSVLPEELTRDKLRVTCDDMRCVTLPLPGNTSSTLNQIFQSNALAIAKVGEPAPWI